MVVRGGMSEGRESVDWAVKNACVCVGRYECDVLSPLLASLGVRSRCVRQRPNVHPLSVLALHSCPLLSPVGFIGWW